MTTGNNVTVTVSGVRETLAALKDLDPELRKQTIAEMRSATRKIATDARNKIPSAPPMSGWQTQPSTRGRILKGGAIAPMVRGGRGWAPWTGEAKRKVKAQVGRQRRQTRRPTWTVARVVSLDAAASMFEFAGKGSSTGAITRDQFVRNVDRHGRPGRAVWAAMDANEGAARQIILQALVKAETMIQRRVG